MKPLREPGLLLVGSRLVELTCFSSFAGLLAGEAEPSGGLLPYSQFVPQGARITDNSRCLLCPYLLPARGCQGLCYCKRQNLAQPGKTEAVCRWSPGTGVQTEWPGLCFSFYIGGQATQGRIRVLVSWPKENGRAEGGC